MHGVGRRFRLTCADRSVGLLADASELQFDAKKDGIEVDFYNGPEDLMNFKIHIEPQNGIYHQGKFTFDVKVPKTYPHDAPKVLCETTVYHPNIDMEGHVCLNILREDWKPVLNMQSVVFGLQYIMLEPNADDPLNKEVKRPPHTVDANECHARLRSDSVVALTALVSVPCAGCQRTSCRQGPLYADRPFYIPGPIKTDRGEGVSLPQVHLTCWCYQQQQQLPAALRDARE